MVEILGMVVGNDVTKIIHRCYIWVVIAWSRVVGKGDSGDSENGENGLETQSDKRKLI